ncbi:MAG: hypothetical protein ACU85U_05920 [Gammaproteobacteria bacterium]|jgi:hypothetical protein
MRSCERASELTSASFDRKLTAMEFVGLWVHRALCAPCRAYRQQLLRLRKRARELDNTPAPDITLDAGAKDRIRERLAARKPTE